MATPGKQLKPWFTSKGRQGDRTLEQQLVGLEPLLNGWVKDKTVLDLGCAEGDISRAMGAAGAVYCHGVDIRADFISHAMGARDNGMVCFFEVGDLNTWRPTEQYDVVLALASLHKLKEPAEACAEFAKAAKELMVIRFPGGKGEVIIDPRSGNVPQNIGEVMAEAGFKAGHKCVCVCVWAPSTN